jgi:hypothetical protein
MQREVSNYFLGLEPEWNAFKFHSGHKKSFISGFFFYSMSSVFHTHRLAGSLQYIQP